MGLRIAVGGFMHETNTFVAKPTTWNDFVEAGPWPTLTIGEGVLSTFRGINLAIAYFMDAAEKAGHVMVPLAWGGAMPGGKVARDAFERMAGIMVDGLRRERPDAVFLELHGAMVAEHHDDGEGELLARVRDTVGPDVPILMSLDLHANVSPAMVAAADFILLLPHLSPCRLGRLRWTLCRMVRPRARRGSSRRARSRQVPFPHPDHHRLHLYRARRSELYRVAEAHRGEDRRASSPSTWASRRPTFAISSRASLPMARDRSRRRTSFPPIASIPIRLGCLRWTLCRMARPRARLEAVGPRAPAGTVPRAGHHRLHLCRAREGALRGAEAHRGRRPACISPSTWASRRPTSATVGPSVTAYGPDQAGGRRRRRSSVRGARRGRAGLCRPSPAAGR